MKETLKKATTSDAPCALKMPRRSVTTPDWLESRFQESRGKMITDFGRDIDNTTAMNALLLLGMIRYRTGVLLQGEQEILKTYLNMSSDSDRVADEVSTMILRMFEKGELEIKRKSATMALSGDR